MRGKCAGMVAMTLLLFFLAACQPVAAPAPLATQAPPTLTATSPRPTASHTLPPTATPTATVAPTRTPTPLPPIATANFAADAINGTWMRTDEGRGNLFLTFTADGSYEAAHGTLDGVIHNGAYTLDGRRLTIVDGWNCEPAASTPGQFVLRLIGGGNWLYFDLYLDDCPDRPAALSGFRWDRYVAP